MPTITLNRKQREAVILTGLERYSTLRGKSGEYTLEWPSIASETMVRKLTEMIPFGGQSSVPFKALIEKIQEAEG